MADSRRKRRGAPKRALIGPLVLLTGGALTSAVVWRLLMLDPRPTASVATEQLSRHDREALQRVLGERPRP
jgi:hypothetical protein